MYGKVIKFISSAKFTASKFIIDIPALQFSLEFLIKLIIILLITPTLWPSTVSPTISPAKVNLSAIFFWLAKYPP